MAYLRPKLLAREQAMECQNTLYQSRGEPGTVALAALLENDLAKVDYDLRHASGDQFKMLQGKAQAIEDLLSKLTQAPLILDKPTT